MYHRDFLWKWRIKGTLRNVGDPVAHFFLVLRAPSIRIYFDKIWKISSLKKTLSGCAPASSDVYVKAKRVKEIVAVVGHFDAAKSVGSNPKASNKPVFHHRFKHHPGGAAGGLATSGEGEVHKISSAGARAGARAEAKPSSSKTVDIYESTFWT